jgi:hypothetical protein
MITKAPSTPSDVNVPSDIHRLAEELRRTGVVKVKQFLPAALCREYAEYLRSSTMYAFQKLHGAPTGANPIATESITFQLFGGAVEDCFEALSKNAIFKETVTALTGRSLIRDSNYALEVSPHDQPGFKWHLDWQSFSPIPTECYGYNLWIPLDPVTDEQKGGVNYIGRDILDGKFVYNFSRWQFERIMAEGTGDNYEATARVMDTIGEVIARVVPDRFFTEYTFDVGDVVVSDKFVLHRSCPMRPGFQKSRLAIFQRFFDADAVFDHRSYEVLTLGKGLKALRPIFFKGLSEGKESPIECLIKEGALDLYYQHRGTKYVFT